MTVPVTEEEKEADLTALIQGAWARHMVEKHKVPPTLAKAAAYHLSLATVYRMGDKVLRVVMWWAAQNKSMALDNDLPEWMTTDVLDSLGRAVSQIPEDIMLAALLAPTTAHDHPSAHKLRALSESEFFDKLLP